HDAVLHRAGALAGEGGVAERAAGVVGVDVEVAGGVPGQRVLHRVGRAGPRVGEPVVVGVVLDAGRRVAGRIHGGELEADGARAAAAAGGAGQRLKVLVEDVDLAVQQILRDVAGAVGALDDVEHDRD